MFLFDIIVASLGLYPIKTLGPILILNVYLIEFLLLQGAVKVMAKDLIRTRHQIEKFYKLKSQLQGVALRIQVHLHSFSLSIMLLQHLNIFYLLSISLPCVYHSLSSLALGFFRYNTYNVYRFLNIFA